MAKLHFIYSTMNAGKSTQLLATRFNYLERGMTCLLLTAALDDRYGTAKITSRMGISADAQVFSKTDDLLVKYLLGAKEAGIACILVDEAQFLTRTQVGQLASAVDMLGIPVMAYGLRTDFRGHLFEGSDALMALSDDLRELKTICHCGRKATMVLRKDASGRPTLEGDQVQIGGNDTYVTLCRQHWTKAHAEARSSHIVPEAYAAE
ncbi:thymidine kinase [Loktanella sp. DJP18]|uniref:thymidine kinase n=1 Tax=Loktanella sp. DJP18 TaxID=3409788 RepID=UPI003BB4CC8C